MEKKQKEMIIPTIKELEKMSEVDIRTVDQESLVELENIEIDTELPEEERICDYIRQIKNPYCYKSHGVVIKISFAGTKSIEECLQEAIKI